MASRNLTYLGSPFQEGFGKAAIEEQQRAPMYFLDQMDKLRQDRKERDKEEAEKKKASLKSLDDFNLDYAIQHNQYFQNGMKEYREKATDFMAKDGDLGDMSSEEAVSLYREKNRLKDEAKLSKSLAENWDAYNKLPADKKGLLSQESIDKFEEFYQIGDLQEQLRLAREGELPTLSVKQQVPQSSVDKVFTDINAKIPNLSTAGEEVTSEWYKRDKARAEEAIRGLVTPEMFKDQAYIINKAGGETTAEAEMESYIQRELGRVAQTYYDYTAKAKIDAGLLKARMGGSASRTSPKSPVGGKFEEWVDGIMKRSRKSLHTRNIVQPVYIKQNGEDVLIDAHAKFKASLTHPNRPNEKGYYVTIRWMDDTGHPITKEWAEGKGVDIKGLGLTPKIYKLENEDGSVNKNILDMFRARLQDYYQKKEGEYGTTEGDIRNIRPTTLILGDGLVSDEDNQSNTNQGSGGREVRGGGSPTGGNEITEGQRRTFWERIWGN